MKVRILKNIDSAHGTFRPGQVVDLPARVAEAWLKKEVVAVVPAPGKPEVIPEGMFWCEKHETLHKITSSTGKKCLRRIEAEKVEAEEAEAEEKPEQEAEAGGQEEEGSEEESEAAEE